MLNKEKINKHFSRAASSYEGLATFQNTWGERLLQEVFREEKSPRRILDIGSGTGRHTRKLAEIYPRTQVTGLDLAQGMITYAEREKQKRNITNISFFRGDAAFLPFPGNSFDIVFSNLSYQWIEELDLAFREVFRVLKKKGRFYFTTLGAGSMEELFSSFLLAHKKLRLPYTSHGQNFLRQNELEDALTKAHFSHKKIESSTEIARHPSVISFLKWLKGVGANNALKKTSGDNPPELIKEMIRIYEKKYRENGNILVNFRVFSGKGRKE